MFFGLNTMLIEAGGHSRSELLRMAADFKFKYIDLACYKLFDPGQSSAADIKDAVKLFKDLGLVSSQLTLLNTIGIASSDASKRAKAQDYMRGCVDMQLELGGRQVLVCWGAGVLETGKPYAESWMQSVKELRDFAKWCEPKGVYVGMELDPHVYFIMNNMERMVRMIEDVGMENLYPNIDIGHLAITREAPECLEKVSRRIYHVHISETDAFAHTNSIIGSGVADFPSYTDACVKYGFIENCARIGEAPVLGIEMGEPEHYVPDVERWIQESLDYLARVMPDVKLS